MTMVSDFISRIGGCFRTAFRTARAARVSFGAAQPVVAAFGAVPLILAVSLMAAACKTEAKYSTKKVTLSMKVVQKSCGFAEVEFHTSKDAYYYVAAEKVREGTDPTAISSQFMTLSLDYAYKEYINWRYELLYNGEKHVADFSSHSLQYGDLDYFFTGLEADTDYWIYGFVVDPKTNAPAGDLVLETVRTDATSKIKVHFNYRVSDTWDYVYPTDKDGQLTFLIPWLGETMDSLTLRNELKAAAPGRYFAQRFTELRESGKGTILYGMYAHNNDGVGDGTSSTLFEDGHTYYTAIASFDGPLIMEGEYRNWNIYKFKWSAGLKRSFTPEDDTLGAW